MQRSSVKKLLVRVLMLSMLFTTGFTTVAKAGGDVYRIYLNNQLILEQFVIEPFDIKKLQLQHAKSTDNIIINYSHCGAVGKGRAIAIKDDKGITLKQWKFTDSNGLAKGMKIPVAEILALQKANEWKHLKFYYTAQEMPKGRTLAVVDNTESNRTT